MADRSDDMFAGDEPAGKKAAPKDPKPKDHRHGHRQRLRERFLRAGADGLQDYELLELLLFSAIPRRDVKEDAKALIATFGSLAEALTASQERLTEAGLPPAAITQFRLAHELAKVISKVEVAQRPVIRSREAVERYVRTAMAYGEVEQFRILFLDKKFNLLADEVMGEGSHDHTPVYPREVVGRALVLKSSQLILVHNHPTGDPTPSRADLEVTKKIQELALGFNIYVHDHIIVGKKDICSFRARGWI